MWPTSITPLLKSDNLEFIDKAFMNSATEPSTREETRLMKEKFSDFEPFKQFYSEINGWNLNEKFYYYTTVFLSNFL